MTYPLDPALYEDLTPSLSQNIAAGLGQNLGVYGMQQFQNYQIKCAEIAFAHYRIN